MNERTQKLLALRPLIASAKILPNGTQEEHFQNRTLRPILKLQNELLLASFQNYIRKQKNKFYQLKLEDRTAYIEYALQRDMKFRNTVKGMIIGQFTMEEYHTYIQNPSGYNKRIMGMTTKRLQDQLQFFEAPKLIQ